MAQVNEYLRTNVRICGYENTNKEIKYLILLLLALSAFVTFIILSLVGIKYEPIQDTEKQVKVVKRNIIFNWVPDTFWVDKTFIKCEGIIVGKHGNKLLVDCKEHYSHTLTDNNKAARTACVGDPCTITEVKTVGPNKTYVKYGKFNKKNLHNSKVSKWPYDKYDQREVRK